MTPKPTSDEVHLAGKKLSIAQPPKGLCVVVATLDPEIQASLGEVLKGFAVRTIWVKGVEAVKRVLVTENVIACFSGFWLQDGTYRELVRYVRRHHSEIPSIVVSGPTCPDEYRDYLAAMKTGAVDFLCYPYRHSDLERMLHSAATLSTHVDRRSTTPVSEGLTIEGAA